jgi:hypothetical protein
MDKKTQAAQLIFAMPCVCFLGRVLWTAFQPMCGRGGHPKTWSPISGQGVLLKLRLDKKAIIPKTVGFTMKETSFF